MPNLLNLNLRCRRHGGARLRRRTARGTRGVTLIELLCVLAIIAILMSLLPPAVTKAYQRARRLVGEIETPEVAYLIVGKCQDYCAANPQYIFTNKTDFAMKCGLVPKARDHVETSNTDFVPFNYRFPTNVVVLTFRYGKHNLSVLSFTKGQLTIRREN